MNLGGHGTIAVIYAMKAKEKLGDKTELSIEKAGILPIKLHSHSNEELYISKKQAAPQFSRIQWLKARIGTFHRN
ncbi:isomerase [Jeotgalibacillus soli]|uniref:Isomerase n=2 Tax=Jeotgalibacillus soli TaxID=889306 RepID=A0A0C2R4E6_9BACL|nr:isomerase [Jeotgalibacillus soli]